MEEFVPFIISNGVQNSMVISSVFTTITSRFIDTNSIYKPCDYILVQDNAYQYVVITTKYLNYS